MTCLDCGADDRTVMHGRTVFIGKRRFDEWFCVPCWKERQENR